MKLGETLQKYFHNVFKTILRICAAFWSTFQVRAELESNKYWIDGVREDGSLRIVEISIFEQKSSAKFFCILGIFRGNI